MFSLSSSNFEPFVHLSVSVMSLMKVFIINAHWIKFALINKFWIQYSLRGLPSHLRSSDNPCLVWNLLLLLTFTPLPPFSLLCRIASKSNLAFPSHPLSYFHPSFSHVYLYFTFCLAAISPLSICNFLEPNPDQRPFFLLSLVLCFLIHNAMDDLTQYMAWTLWVFPSQYSGRHLSRSTSSRKVDFKELFK